MVKTKIKEMFTAHGFRSFVLGYLISLWITVVFCGGLVRLFPGAYVGVVVFGFIMWVVLGGFLWVVGVEAYVGRLFAWLRSLAVNHVKTYTVLVAVLSITWLPIFMLASVYVVWRLLRLFTRGAER